MLTGRELQIYVELTNALHSTGSSDTGGSLRAVAIVMAAHEAAAAPVADDPFRPAVRGAVDRGDDVREAPVSRGGI